MKKPIKFGTDGWRGIIAQDYTFDNVRACAQGVGYYIQEQGLAQRGLVVGYDTRFASEYFARAAAEVLAAQGVKVYLCDKACPTPVAAYNIVARGAAGAVIITASHNPPEWNGFKYRPQYAGSASPEVIAALEDRIAQALSEEVHSLPLDQGLKEGYVEWLDPLPPYREQVQRLVNLEAIRKAGLKVVADVMFGAGAGYFKTFLEGGPTRVTEIHSERNPLFPGLSQPEPVAHNLGPLSRAVVTSGASVGIAVDGDADRLGIMDERGRFITPLQTFPLLALHLLEHRGQKGPLVKSLTCSRMVFRLGELFQVPVFETPVGFKYVGPMMIQKDALMGGEESGGFAFRGHIPERDGILSALLFLEVMALTGQSPSALVADLYRRLGPYYYKRLDIPLAHLRRHDLEERLDREERDSVAGYTVTARDRLDGYRFFLEGDRWVILRFSGTEPLVRIYAEGRSPEEADQILEDFRRWVLRDS